VNLVDDDELANLSAQKQVRVLKAPLISGTLKVKVYCPRLPQVSDLASQRGFACLARAERYDVPSTSWCLLFNVHSKEITPMPSQSFVPFASRVRPEVPR